VDVTATGNIYEGTPGRQTPILPFSELQNVHADEGPSSADHLAPIPAKYPSVFTPLPDKLPPQRSVDHKIDIEPGTVPPFKGVYSLAGCRLPSWQS
jgi:hypothetical protein